MSFLTWSVAVAVSAITGIPGKLDLRCESFLYDDLKSLPHIEIQCASSMTNLLSKLLFFMCIIQFMNDIFVSIDSGVVYINLKSALFCSIFE